MDYRGAPAPIRVGPVLPRRGQAAVAAARCRLCWSACSGRADRPAGLSSGGRVIIMPDT